MDNETIAAIVGFVVFGILVFVLLFTIARILMRDRRVRQVRIGFYMERERDRYDDEYVTLPSIGSFPTPTSEQDTLIVPPKESGGTATGEKSGGTPR
jgi:hypothetical protein